MKKDIKELKKEIQQMKEIKKEVKELSSKISLFFPKMEADKSNYIKKIQPDLGIINSISADIGKQTLFRSWQDIFKVNNCENHLIKIKELTERLSKNEDEIQFLREDIKEFFILAEKEKRNAQRAITMY